MTTPLRVLIVEDKPADAELIVLRLAKEGFKLDWKRVQTEADFIASLETNWDLVLADWSLPQFSGLRALQLVRARGLEIPFIIVSGAIGEEAAIDAMHKGADDYLLKDRPERLGLAVHQALAQKESREERKRAELLREVVFEIIAKSITTQNLHDFLSLVHKSISKIINAENFFIVLYNKNTDRFEEVYFVDKFDPPAGDSKMKKSTSAYVFRTGEPFLFTQKRFEELEAQGEMELVGKRSPSWLGVPLKTSQETIGVMVVQDYEKEDCYSKREVDFLVSIAGEVAHVIERKQSEEKLVSNFNLLRMAGEYGAFGGWSVDLKNNICTWSDVVADIHEMPRGYSPLVDEGINFYAPEWREKIIKVFSDCTQQGISYDEEMQIITKNGKHVWVRTTGEAVKDGNGKIVKIQGTFQDISERKQAEEALRTSELRNSHIIEGTNVGTWEWNVQTGETVFNQRWAEIVGYSLEELAPVSIKTWTDLAHPDDLKQSEELLEKHFQGSLDLYDCEIRMRHKNGTWVWVQDRGRVITHTADGKPLMMFGTHSDISKRKQLEEKIQKSEKLYRSLFENMINGFAYCRMEYDHQGKPIDFTYLLVNEAFETQTGLKDAAGRKVSEVIPGIQKSDPGLIETYGRVAKTGKAESFEVYVESLQMWFSLSVYCPERDYFVAVFDVITDRKKAEAEIILRVNQLATAREIGKTLTETLELDQIYERLYQSVIKLLSDSETMFISLFDHEKKEFRCVFAISENERLDISQLPPAPLEPPGIGTQGETVHTRKPLIVANLPERLKKVSLVVNVGEGGEDPQSGLYVPMLAKGEVIGVVTVQSQKINRYTPDDAEMLSLVANTAASAIQNAQLFAQTERRLQQISAMHTIDATISSSFDLELTFTILLEIVTSQLGVDAADVLVLNKNNQILECRGRRGFHTQALQYTKLPVGQGLAGRAALERKMLVIKDLPGEKNGLISSPELAAEGFVTYLGVPLTAKGEIMGVLEIFHREKLEPAKEWFDYLENLAGQAAIAIDNSLLYNNLQRSNLDLSLAYDATLLGWSNALDLRDKETEGHSERVMEMTMQLALRMELSEEELVHVRRGSLLHDIGKMGVADSILLKAGPLTEEEWVIMRSHPLLAYNLLAPIPYLQKSLEIPYCHHEKWDGTGYPRGLKGEQIPLPARIFAVVDVWDALISDRPYRKAWTKQKALDYIREQAGKHFDPQVVKEFLQLDGFKKQKE